MSVILIFVVESISGGLERNIEYVGTDENIVKSFTPSQFDNQDIEISVWEKGVKIDRSLIEAE
ncbi:hypothetical protein KDN24_06600 [Bacillus sp. Bva_UNVM-123]|uniref:hypothetical protein n=1 Tax=Bacillus sp. Bva_UNVM-123 TaxID=2829798 RepID=UPI00391F0EE8